MFSLESHFPADIYLFKVNNKNTEARCEMFKFNTKDTRTTPMVLSLMPLLLTLNIFHTLFRFSIVNFEQVIVGLVCIAKYLCSSCNVIAFYEYK